ncbi:MAG TPA: sugar O-acetyltransferase [Oculatellaceae cyanobacterium]
MTELERMNRGEWYDPRDSEIAAMHQVARRLCRQFNRVESDEERAAILVELFGDGLGKDVYICETFHCDFPGRLVLGDRVFMNYGCKILNCGKVTIGEEVRFAPGVTVIAVKHPIDGRLRNYEPGNRANLAVDVKIGARTWIGAGAVIQPGVTIGEDVVIMANAVVTKDVPSGQIWGGVPAKFVKHAAKDYGPDSL